MRAARATDSARSGLEEAKCNKRTKRGGGGNEKLSSFYGLENGTDDMNGWVVGSNLEQQDNRRAVRTRSRIGRIFKLLLAHGFILLFDLIARTYNLIVEPLIDIRSGG